ncbi:MAG: alpha-glucosidase [Pontixanthobacter sp.]
MANNQAMQIVPVQDAEWWRGASIYQIYPRSFMDSNGDGIGDLPGITAKLDYVASLGVDAIWISPYFTSPMLDFGYDVQDFCGVDPIFGTLGNFDALVTRAHALGLKIIIDQVYSHTSDRHAWFTESRASRDNPKADWYVWADPKPDGTPPNNWQSIFSGSAWNWDARRQQFYFHNFLPQQPDLNLHNGDVQDALLDAGRFWLDRGVDGFRVDAVLHFMHDPALTDNPPLENGTKRRTRGHDFQQNIHNQGHPDILDFLARIRQLIDEYGRCFTVAEVGDSGSLEFTKECAKADERLNSAYGFDFLYADTITPDLVCRVLTNWPDDPGTGWPSWAFENHDAPRAVSRWPHHGHKDAFLRFKMTLLCALRGNIILFQGEELGLEQVDIPYELVQDPEALRNWPLTLSRDGARTPLPWLAQAEHGGFSQAEPWLPVGDHNRARAVDRQDGDKHSLLNFTRAMIALRNDRPALRLGRVERCEADGDLLRLTRGAGGEALTWLLNFGATNIPVADHTADQNIVTAINGGIADILPPFAGLLLEG